MIVYQAEVRLKNSSTPPNISEISYCLSSVICGEGNVCQIYMYIIIATCSWLITSRAAASLKVRPRPKSNCLPSWANAPWFPTRETLSYYMILYIVYIYVYIFMYCFVCRLFFCALCFVRCTKIQRQWDFVIVILKCFRIYFIFLRRSLAAH